MNLLGGKSDPVADYREAEDAASRIYPLIDQSLPDVRAANEIVRVCITEACEAYARRKVEEALAKHCQDERPDGNWLDKWGTCRVCGGEIPHGHTDNCDIFKYEKMELALTEDKRKALEFATGCNAQMASAQAQLLASQQECKALREMIGPSRQPKRDL